MIGVQQIDRVVEVVEEALKGKSPLGRVFSGVLLSHFYNVTEEFTSTLVP